MTGDWKVRGGSVLLLLAILGLLLAVARGFRTTGGAWAVALAALGVFGAALWLIARSSERPVEDAAARAEALDTRFLVVLVAVGFLLRCFVAFAIHPGGNTALFLGPDEQTFDENGWQFALWLDNATHPNLRLGYRYLDSLQVGYFYLVGFIYHMFGHHLMLPILFNCAIGALCSLPAYAIANELLDRRAGRIAAILLGFFPSLFLWSTLLIRDMLVIFVLLVMFWLVIQLKRRFTLTRLLFLCAMLATLGTLRQYLFLVAGLSVGMAFLVGQRALLGRNLAIGIAVVIGLVLLVKVGFGQFELSQASLESLAQRRRWNAIETAGGAFHVDIDISTPTNALTYLPTGMIWFLFAPFPWQAAGTRQLLALPDVLVWYALFPVTLLGLGHLIRRRLADVAVLLVFVITLTVLYSLVEGNVGIIFRHRAQILAPLLCCAGVGISLRRRRREEAAEGVRARPPPGLPVVAPARVPARVTERG